MLVSVKILLNKLNKRVQFDMRKVKSLKFTQNGKSKLQQVDRTSNETIKISKLRDFLVWLRMEIRCSNSVRNSDLYRYMDVVFL